MTVQLQKFAAKQSPPSTVGPIEQPPHRTADRSLHVDKYVFFGAAVFFGCFAIAAAGMLLGYQIVGVKISGLYYQLQWDESFLVYMALCGSAATVLGGVAGFVSFWTAAAAQEERPGLGRVARLLMIGPKTIVLYLPLLLYVVRRWQILADDRDNELLHDRLTERDYSAEFAAFLALNGRRWWSVVHILAALLIVATAIVLPTFQAQSLDTSPLLGLTICTGLSLIVADRWFVTRLVVRRDAGRLACPIALQTGRKRTSAIAAVLKLLTGAGMCGLIVLGCLAELEIVTPHPILFVVSANLRFVVGALGVVFLLHGGANLLCRRPSWKTTFLCAVAAAVAFAAVGWSLREIQFMTSSH